MNLQHRLADVADAAIELPVVTSFTRIGHDVRRRLDDWSPVDDDLHGRVVVLTGATSGLGLAAAEQLAGLGATLVLVGRDEQRTRAVRDRLAAGFVGEHINNHIVGAVERLRIEMGGGGLRLGRRGHGDIAFLVVGGQRGLDICRL